jgi:hypothetical protein
MRRSDACRFADAELPRKGVCGIGWTAVATAVVGAVAAQAIGGMMAPDQPQGGGTAPAMPEAVKTPTPMPVAPGASSKAKAERSLAQQMSMTRASTILSDDNSKLG